MQATLSRAALLAALIGLAGGAQAALVSQGDGTVLDTNTNLIWLQDWNRNGPADWATQKAWAEGFNFAGSTDWVLPEVSEYNALFIAYGHLASVSQFTNAQSYYYWTSTAYAPNPNVPWMFLTGNGPQVSVGTGFALFAVAVRPGDATAPVPEPQTLALTLLALGATLVARRKRPR